MRQSVIGYNIYIYVLHKMYTILACYKVVYLQTFNIGGAR